MKTQLVLYLGSLAACMMAGCSTPPSPHSMAFTETALADTDPSKIKGLEHGSTNETAIIARFKKFNETFTPENLTNNTKVIYAPDVYFRDAFKQIHGEPEFEKYLQGGCAATAFYSMEWKDVSESNGNYYFRWVMTTKLKRDGKKWPPTVTPGISHVRFRADGQVTFQQDYYDAGGFLYEKLPIVGPAIRFIKKRM